jgi:hypothetical protein
MSIDEIIHQMAVDQHDPFVRCRSGAIPLIDTDYVIGQTTSKASFPLWISMARCSAFRGHPAYIAFVFLPTMALQRTISRRCSGALRDLTGIWPGSSWNDPTFR